MVQLHSWKFSSSRFMSDIWQNEVYFKEEALYTDDPLPFKTFTIILQSRLPPFTCINCSVLTAWRAQGLRIPTDLVLATKTATTASTTTHSKKQQQPLQSQQPAQTRHHQRYHSQYYPRQHEQHMQQQKPSQHSINSFPRSTSGVLAPGRRAIVTHGETAVPCRVTLFGSDTQGVEKGMETLVPPPQFRLVPVNPPAAASWHLQVTAGQTPQRIRCSGDPTSSSKSGRQRDDWQQDKPRSWDNLLSTKSFGGYGFGYSFIDINAARPKSKVAPGARSVSTNRLNEDNDNPESESTSAEVWTGVEGSRTVPRRIRTTTNSADNLVSPPDMSSCFSCDCIGIEHTPLETCTLINKPKSTESLLAGPSLHTAASATSLVETATTPTPYRRRSKTSSLADCLGGNHHSPTDQLTHL